MVHHMNEELTSTDIYNITNREKYFSLIATTIFCAERPSGYFKCEDFADYRYLSVPERAMEGKYPTDIVNYLVAGDEIITVNRKYGFLNSKGEEEVNEEDEEVEDSDSGSSNDTIYYPVPQRYLGDDHDDNGLSCYYDKLATKNQCIPPRYISLVKMGTRLMDEDAVSLLMNECGYYPNSIILSGSKSIQWKWKKEELQKLLSKFFCDLEKICLYPLEKPDDGDVVLASCFNNSKFCSLSLHLERQLVQLNLSLMVSPSCLKRLSIHAYASSLTDTLDKELAEILQYQKDLHELTVKGNVPDFLVNVLTFISNPNFCKFSLDVYEIISSLVLTQLLATFMSTPCSHPQELSMQGMSHDDLMLAVVQQPPIMPLAVCSSALQHKSLKWSGLSCKVCNWLLSLKPLALESLSLRCNQCSLEEKHKLLETVASNDALQVCNLTLTVGKGFLYVYDPAVECPVSEEHIKSILKRPHLKSLELNFEWNSCDLTVMTNALSVQIQLGTLEKLSITFNQFTKPPVSDSDIELLLEMLFKLPQISQFSFHFDARLTDLEIVHTIYKYFQGKEPKEFRFGHFPGLTITERIQCLIDEMQLSVHKERCTLVYPECCHGSEHLMLCTPCKSAMSVIP